MELEQMSIAEHEAEINRLSDSVRPIRAEMQTHHDLMEAKLRRIPASGGPGQIVNPGTDWVSFVANLPAAGLEQLKKILNGDK